MEGSWWGVLMKQLCTTFQTFTNVLKSMPSDLLSKLARLKKSTTQHQNCSELQISSTHQVII